MSVANAASGWLVNGFESVVVLWAWMAMALLHGLWRSMWKPAADPIRPAGPTGAGARKER